MKQDGAGFIKTSPIFSIYKPGTISKSNSAVGLELVEVAPQLT